MSLIKSTNRLDNDSYDLCQILLKEKRYNSINDFDNHLDDIKLDWRNLALNKSISPKTETLRRSE